MVRKPRQRATGSLRHYISVQDPTDTIDSAGQTVPTWATTVLRDWPAEVVDVQGIETSRGEQITAITTHLVETRYSDQFTPDRRITDHKGRILQIVSVVDRDGRGRYLTIQCRQVTL